MCYTTNVIFIKFISKLFFFNSNSTWEDRHTNENENRNAELKSILRRLLSANEILQHSATIRDLVDEHSTSVFVKIASKIFEFVEIIHENITTDEILPSLSLVVTVIFILIGGRYFTPLIFFREIQNLLTFLLLHHYQDM